MIIVFGSDKGGTGKTTLATNLVVLAMRDSENVLFVDSDKNKNASKWCEARDDNEVEPRVTCIQKRGKNIFLDIKDLKKKYDHIFIDTGGFDSQELRSSLLAADILIVPIRPSQFDIWTLSEFNNMVGQAKINNEGLKGWLVFNQASTHPRARDRLAFMQQTLEHLILAETVISKRDVFMWAPTHGKSVLEVCKTHKASNDITELYEEIFNGS